jgi:hypothetical protein
MLNFVYQVVKLCGCQEKKREISCLIILFRHIANMIQIRYNHYCKFGNVFIVSAPRNRHCRALRKL